MAAGWNNGLNHLPPAKQRAAFSAGLEAAALRQARMHRYPADHRLLREAWLWIAEQRRAISRDSPAERGVVALLCPFNPKCAGSKSTPPDPEESGGGV